MTVLHKYLNTLSSLKVYLNVMKLRPRVNADILFDMQTYQADRRAVQGDITTFLFLFTECVGRHVLLTSYNFDHMFQKTLLLNKNRPKMIKKTQITVYSLWDGVIQWLHFWLKSLSPFTMCNFTRRQRQQHWSCSVSHRLAALTDMSSMFSTRKHTSCFGLFFF